MEIFYKLIEVAVTLIEDTIIISSVVAISGRRYAIKKHVLGVWVSVVAMSLAILMSVSLSGCGKDSSSEDDAKESTSVVSEISDESSDVESEPETEKPKKEESSKKEQSSKKESSKEESSESEEVSSSFKETMDEYEEFMDKYVDFMKSYDANDVTMLSEYTELLSQYNTYMDKVSKIDEDELSSADLAYYLDVTNRVNKKLLEVQ